MVGEAAEVGVFVPRFQSARSFANTSARFHRVAQAQRPAPMSFQLMSSRLRGHMRSLRGYCTSRARRVPSETRTGWGVLAHVQRVG